MIHYKNGVFFRFWRQMSKTNFCHCRLHVRRFFFAVNKRGEICSSMDSSTEDSALNSKRIPRSTRDRRSGDKGGFDRDTFAMTSPDSEVFQDPPSFAKLSAGGSNRGRNSAGSTSSPRRSNEPALFYYSVCPPPACSPARARPRKALTEAAPVPSLSHPAYP